MKNAKCIKCLSRSVRTYSGPGRTTRYRNIAAVPIPLTFGVPTCRRCRSEYYDAPTMAALTPLLHQEYLQELKQRAKDAIDILMRYISQRRLERLLGLSQGYLSRVRAGSGNPSAELVSNLALLAHDPKVRLLELERYWAIPRPRTEA